MYVLSFIYERLKKTAKLMTMSKKGGMGQEKGQIQNVGEKNDIFFGGEWSKTNVIFYMLISFC